MGIHIKHASIGAHYANGAYSIKGLLRTLRSTRDLFSSAVGSHLNRRPGSEVVHFDEKKFWITLFFYDGSARSGKC